MDDKKQFWQNVFILYDKENEDKINLSQLDKYLRAVGLVIERRELNAVIDEFNGAGTTKLDFSTIWNKFSEKPPITDEEIVEAFKTFSPSGKISKEELKFIFTNLGDKISEKEVQDFFKHFTGNDEEIDYQEFLNRYGISG